jgi:hypothetical protein
MAEPNPRKLGPAELVRLLNSTRLGTVTTARKVQIHREAAGFRIGDGKTVDLIRYAAWLVTERHRPKPPALPGNAHERHRERARQASINASITERDIAPDYPPPGDLATRNACEWDFRLFCETYFPHAFYLAWSDDHLKAIARMEEVALGGGLFALAMPRASGKTALSVRCALWALLYGHRRFVSLIAATEELAGKLMKPFKTELAFNERLAADFRQVAYPIQRLENNGRKAIGQLFQGQQTRIEWGEGQLTFPTMPDSACDGKNVSGSTIAVAGITGAIRGQSSTLATGEVIRPELVLLDDPQTRESASSASQSRTRAEIISGDVLGMAGPGQKIAAIMPCTVIRAGDMADLMLDRKLNPEWSGQKTKMVYAFPKAENLWKQYSEIRNEAMEAGRKPTEATDFYASHRAAMDEGSRVAWEARYGPGELSAIQHAMNLQFRDPRMFACEYQNDPMPLEDSSPDDLSPDEICSKLNRLDRGQVPTSVEHITAFVDISGTVLWWLVCGWEEDFTGYILDYGAYPDQRVPYFTLRDVKITLADVVKATGLEGQIYGGLEAIGRTVLDREWRRDDGASLKIERCLIDVNWIDSTDTALKFCRQSSHSAILMPSRGKYVGAAGTPMAEWAKRPGERKGLNWKVTLSQDRKDGRRVIFDSNFWKSFVHTRLGTAMGDRGVLTLFGDRPDVHRMLADQLCAEFRVRTVGRGRECDEWKSRPSKPDNHFLDCLAGCAVAASMQGVAIQDGGKSGIAPKKERIRMSDLQRRKRA